MLNQRYFSGIGNLLRAEILYRLDIDPYLSARSVLENLTAKSCDHHPDILKMCNIVSWELIGLNIPYESYDGVKCGHVVLKAWLKCYNVKGMGNSVDNWGKNMWHSFKYGKGRHSRHAIDIPSEIDDNDLSKWTRTTDCDLDFNRPFSWFCPVLFALFSCSTKDRQMQKLGSKQQPCYICKF